MMKFCCDANVEQPRYFSVGWRRNRHVRAGTT